MLFWASLGALLVGPLVLTTLGDRRSVVAFLDGYVMVAVGGLIGLHILPHALHHAGTWALAGAAVDDQITSCKVGQKLVNHGVNRLACRHQHHHRARDGQR